MRTRAVAIVLTVAIALAACGGGPRRTAGERASDDVLRHALPNTMRPALVLRDWNAEQDFAREEEQPIVSPELTVVVRDVTRPDIVLPMVQVQLIQLFDDTQLDAGATSTSAVSGPVVAGSTDWTIQPLMGITPYARYILRVAQSSYRPADILVELAPSCRAVIEVYLQPGYKGRGRMPPPRATLTTCAEGP